MPFYIIANWKMNEGKPSAEGYIRMLNSRLKDMPRSRTIIICPPFTHLSRVSRLIRNTRIKLGAQDVSSEHKGAFTGDVPASFVSAEGASFVIVGHSERRRFHGETESIVRMKLIEVLSHKMTPILCIGETKSERSRGLTKKVLKKQLSGTLRGVKLSKKRIIIAYEPVWAISTSKNARHLTSEEISEMLKEVRSLALSHISGKPSELSVIYGGSVDYALSKKMRNARDVNGFLVGGASLDPKKFISIATA